MKSPPPIGFDRFPREITGSLAEAIHNADHAAATFERLLESGDAALIEQIGQAEQVGDRIVHDLIRQLRDARLSAADRGALLRLIQAVDDIVDAVEAAAHGTVGCDCGHDGRALAGVLRDTVGEEADLVNRALAGDGAASGDRHDALLDQGRRLARTATAHTLEQDTLLAALRQERCVEQITDGLAASRRVAHAARTLALKR